MMMMMCDEYVMIVCSTEQRRQLQNQTNEEFDRRQGTVVCKHWLRSLCKKAEMCEFLHRYDIKKMRECEYRTKEDCGVARCPFRHVDVEEEVEQLSCVAYDLGFCPDGRLMCKILCSLPVPY